MPNDIQMMKDRRSANKKVIYALEIGIDTDIKEMRTYLDPFEIKTELRTKEIIICADKIKTQVDKLKELTAVNKRITAELDDGDPE